jgi:RNA polymerase sigma-70 factor (ECF subfamily)
MVAASSVPDSAESSFERLFLEEYARVVSVAYRITGDRAEAEDVAQEAFVQLARAGIQPGAVQGWLYRAAVHGAMNAVRSRRRRSERERRDFRLERSLRDAGERATDPLRIVERRDDAAQLRAALLRIGERDAGLLALRYAGLSYREIAETTGTGAAQVGTRLARAERALRREIERETSR